MINVYPENKFQIKQPDIKVFFFKCVGISGSVFLIKQVKVRLMKNVIHAICTVFKRFYLPSNLRTMH